MKQCVLQLRNKREKGTSMQTLVMQSGSQTILPQESKHCQALMLNSFKSDKLSDHKTHGVASLHLPNELAL